MVLMSDVWDRTSATIALRTGSFAAILLLLVWLPGVVRGVVAFAATPAGAAAPVGAGAVVSGLVGLVAAALAVLGHLALVAQASEPLPTWRTALTVAAKRFWPYLGIMVPVAIAGLVLVAPMTIAIAAAYPSIAAMRAGGAPTVSPGIAAFVALYAVAAAVVALWVQARVLSVLPAVVVNERLGLASYRRAWSLTRGLTWRILGVILLFAVLVAVTMLAVQGVAGVALRLILGIEHVGLALLVTAALVALAAAVAWAVAAAFTARLYLSVRDLRTVA